MSESQSTSGAPDQSSGVDQGQGQQKDFVQYSTYQKVLSEAKSAKEKLREFEQKAKEEQDAKLQEQGEYKKLLEEKAKALKAKEEENLKIQKTFGLKVFTTEAKRMAMELGASPEALDDIVKVGDFSDVEIGDDFTINQEQLKSALTRLQASKPYFFKKSVAVTKDVHTSASAPVGKKVTDMSVDELMQMAQNMDKK